MLRAVAVVSCLAALAACAAPERPGPMADKPTLGMFITSAGPGNGAALGGLAGADAHCKTLADAVGKGGRVWRAYLSTQATAGAPAVNARDRIGMGPWLNAKGEVVAADLAALHGTSGGISKTSALDEQGRTVNGRGDTPNVHDILTGSQADGTAFAAGADKTCRNWTSSTDGSAQAGHHDRQGGGPDPTSWNAAHGTRGCSQANLVSTGGNGLFYCFAAD